MVGEWEGDDPVADVIVEAPAVWQRLVAILPHPAVGVVRRVLVLIVHVELDGAFFDRAAEGRLAAGREGARVGEGGAHHTRRGVLVAQPPVLLREAVHDHVRARALEARAQRALGRWRIALLKRRGFVLPVGIVLGVEAVVGLGAANGVDGHPQPLRDAPARHVLEVQGRVGRRPRVKRRADDLVDALAAREILPALGEKKGGALLLDEQRVQRRTEVGRQSPLDQRLAGPNSPTVGGRHGRGDIGEVGIAGIAAGEDDPAMSARRRERQHEAEHERRPSHAP